MLPGLPPRGGRGVLHAAAVLAAHVVEGRGDLAEGAVLHRIDEHREHVAVLDDRLLELGQPLGRFVLVALVEVGEAGQLALLLVFAGAGQLDLLGAAQQGQRRRGSGGHRNRAFVRTNPMEPTL